MMPLKPGKRRLRARGWGGIEDEVAGYFPLFLVVTTARIASYAIYYLSADLQKPAGAASNKASSSWEVVVPD
jgi:hypothetical protein